MAYHHPPPHPGDPALPSLGQSSFASLSLANVLEDLCARFIVNLPAEELESMDRVCFQIEQAHWYYEDFIRPSAINPALLPSYGLKAFSLLMFKSCPLLHDLVPSHGKIWTSFMAYKERVPVCGAIMISEYWDKVLLVKGWNKGASWSFPRGKINKQEPEAMCAVREVLEETGYDLTSAFPPHQLHPSYQGEDEGVERVPYYVELVIREQKIRLYFVPGVPENTRFETRTRKEISKIDWFRLSSLPTWNQHQRGGKGAGSMRSKGELENGKQAKFYMVTPFISHLKLWIDRNKPKNLPQRPPRSSAPLSPDLDSPRPYNPTPHHAALGHHPLVPWDDATYHLPSETEQEHSDLGETSGTTSTEDEQESEDGERTAGLGAPQTWQTTEEGNAALQALFFGSPPAQPAAFPSSSSVNLTSPSTASLPLSQHPTPPARPLPIALPHRSSSSQLSDAAATPPQVAYERQQSFLQPRPQQHKNQQGQQARLLELLTGQGLSTPPPPAPVVASSGPQPDGTGSLLGLLNGMHLSSAPSSSDASHPSSSHAQAHASILFGGASYASSTDQPHNAFSASPPPEAHGAVEPESSRGEDEKREKHNALLRALFSVAAKSPPQPPPREFLDPAAAEDDSQGLAGTPRSDEIEALFHSGGSSGSHGGGRRPARRLSTLEVEGQQVDAQGWPIPSGAPHGALYSMPNEQLAVPGQTPLTQAPHQSGWTSLSSSDEASDGSRRRQPGASAAQGKGSLLAILNQPGYSSGDGAALSSPSASAYSQPSAVEELPSPPAQGQAKDPLQILREYRNKQLGLPEQPPVPVPAPAPAPAPVAVAQPVASLPSPQTQPQIAYGPQQRLPLPGQPRQQYYSPPQPAPIAVPPQPAYQPALPPPQPAQAAYLPTSYPAAVPPALSHAYPQQPPLAPAAYSQPPPPGYAVPPPSHSFPLQPQSSYPAAYTTAPPPSFPPQQTYPAQPLFPPSQQTSYAPRPSYPLQPAVPQPHRPQPLPFPPQPQTSAPYPGIPGLPPQAHAFPQTMQQPSFGVPQPVQPQGQQKPNAGALLGLLNAKG
ncbi:hypothetical protein JCM10213_003810 [Rhodosporidiobolus nylandii]